MKNIIIALITVITLLSCTTTKYIEVPVDRISTEYRDRLQIDTFVKLDSVIIRDKGDTVCIEKFKYIYKTNEIRDTVNITDTVTVVKVVEKKTTENNGFFNLRNIILLVVGVFIIMMLIFNTTRNY